MTYVTHLLLQDQCCLECCHSPDISNISAGACKFLLEKPFKKADAEK
jgi:hypothetical protein